VVASCAPVLIRTRTVPVCTFAIGGLLVAVVTMSRSLREHYSSDLSLLIPPSSF